MPHRLADTGVTTGQKRQSRVTHTVKNADLKCTSKTLMNHMSSSEKTCFKPIHVQCMFRLRKTLILKIIIVFIIYKKSILFLYVETLI